MEDCQGKKNQLTIGSAHDMTEEQFVAFVVAVQDVE